MRTCDALNWKPTLIQLLFDHLSKQMAPEDLALLEQLLFCDGLAKSDWDPTKTRHDGMAFGPTWELPDGCWMEHRGTRSIEQSAILILADLEAIKAVEHDFPSYFQFPDNSYLEIQPKHGQYLRVPREDRATCDAAALSLSIRSDLPFPFSSYALDLSILHRQRSSEDLITYIHGQGEDIHWLAGYDRYWTVKDGQGKPVCTLIVRQLAFDIAGVPDKSKHRREGIRSGLGNLRRNAEVVFRGDWPGEDPKAMGIPEFPVLVPIKD